MPQGGLEPNAVVLVATIRALKSHGGIAKADFDKENVKAVADGGANLAHHIANIKAFGAPMVVAINRFVSDTQAEVDMVKQICSEHDVDVVVPSSWI